jgi:hypothetical protein
MRRLIPTEGREFDFPARDPARRAEAISAMGYRLAAAGPRTRQRLLERDAGAADDTQKQAAWLPPGIASGETASAWDSEEEEIEPGLARLSTEHRGVRVWRAAAILASAGCGFALVLYGQTIPVTHPPHRLASVIAKPALLAQPQPAPSAPAAAPADAPAQQPDAPALPPSLAPASSQPSMQAAASAPVPDSGAPPAPMAAVPATSASAHPAAAPAVGAAPASVADSAPSARPVAPPAPARAPEPARAQPVAPRAFAAWRPALPRAAARPVFAMATRSPAPKPLQAKQYGPVRTASAQYELPRWLTEDRPQQAQAHVLIMSPPPHDLEPPAGAEPPRQIAAAPPAPKPARRPALIYAEAHTPPPRPPNYYPAPYYYPPGYGYYGNPYAQ